MPFPCLTCTHPRRRVIDRALAGATALGATSKRFGISVDALRRHQQNHLAEDNRIAPQSVAGSGCQKAVRDPSEFVELALVPSVASPSEVEVELRTDGTGTSLRLRGRLEPEALHVLARAVVGRPGSAS